MGGYYMRKKNHRWMLKYLAKRAASQKAMDKNRIDELDRKMNEPDLEEIDRQYAQMMLWSSAALALIVAAVMLICSYL